MDGPSADGDYDYDMCDTCDVVLHTQCLTSYTNLRGECSLCLSCLHTFRNAGGVKLVTCDFHSLPVSLWEELHGKFCTDSRKSGNGDGARVRVPTGVKEDDASRLSIEEVVSLRRTLDCHLEHMVKYLELDQEGCFPEEFRSDVLGEVKTTMSWKQNPLTVEQLTDKIAELSEFMQRSLKQYC